MEAKMAYRLAAEEDPVEGLYRCAREQLDSAIENLAADGQGDPVRAIHEARKSLKKARSVMRLARGALTREARSRDNTALRDAGRALARARDADVLLQALDALAERYAGQLPKQTFAAVRKRLKADQRRARAGLGAARKAEADELRAVRTRMDEWPVRADGWKVIETALKRSYRRGRAAFARTRGASDDDNLHEWRKREKDLWYHLRLLRPTSFAIVGGQADAAHGLSDLLGDDHDLVVLRSVLSESPHDEADVPADIDALLSLIDHRREQLRTEAFLAGERLYAERPKVFVRRMRRYRKAWEGEREADEESRPAELATATSP
jgi:CHAD domain-containing protein